VYYVIFCWNSFKTVFTYTLIDFLCAKLWYSIFTSLYTRTGCFTEKKYPLLKLFGILSLRVSLFCVKFCTFVGNSYAHISTNFRSCILMASNGINFSTSTHRFHPVIFWEYTQKMKMQLFGNNVIFSSSRLLASDNCKQSITVWFFTINVLLTLVKILIGLTNWKIVLQRQSTWRCFVGKDIVRKPLFPVTLTKGDGSALFRKCAVESTAPVQPFCVNPVVETCHSVCMHSLSHTGTIFQLVGPTEL